MLPLHKAELGSGTGQCPIGSFPPPSELTQAGKAGTSAAHPQARKTQRMLLSHPLAPQQKTVYSIQSGTYTCSLSEWGFLCYSPGNEDKQDGGRSKEILDPQKPPLCISRTRSVFSPLPYELKAFSYQRTPVPASPSVGIDCHTNILDWLQLATRKKKYIYI